MITIDSWEKQESPDDFAPRLIKLCDKVGIPYEVKPLHTGDIRFIGAALEIVVIERKSTQSDLFSSSRARLQDQCLRLVEVADDPILLIDGPLTVSPNGFAKGEQYTTNWRFSAITHMLLSIQRLGVRVIQVAPSTHTPTEVIDLYRYYQKSDHISLVESRLKPFPGSASGLTPEQRKLRVLMSFPSVGPEIAKRLLADFGSITAIVQATADELVQVPGVGAERAAAITEILGGNHADTPSDGQPATSG